MKRLALISAPWPMFNRPSVQLGTLKAFIGERLPRLRVDTFHFYLQVASGLGYRLYRGISRSTWLSEPLYSALLYPERRGRIERSWGRRKIEVPGQDPQCFSAILEKIEAISDRIIDNVDWAGYGLIGFSICLGQLTSSLYFIKRIKERAPASRIVIGGSSCAGAMGKSIVDKFSEVDYLVSGEGEGPLLELLNRLERGGQDRVPCPVSSSQLPDINELPVPDYEDFFKDLACLSPDKRFIPVIPIEISRGCWWNRGGSGGCRFCNLNIQWKGYRQKSNQRVVNEIDYLCMRHEALSVSFVDNLLPASRLKQLFKAIRGLGRDLDMFCEIRATTAPEVLNAMAEAGMSRLQVGVESLSSSLLRKFNKGTRVIDNIGIMKQCEAGSMPELMGNLILCFPSSDEQDAAETMRNLDFVMPFRPLKGIDFWLGYGSPVWEDPDRFGIRLRGNHRLYKDLFPEDTFKALKLIMQAYSGNIRYQQRLWRPVREKIKAWEESYRIVASAGKGPVLCYRDGGDFMIIRQRCAAGEEMSHRLRGDSRRIYLFCSTKKGMEQILAEFSSHRESEIRSFLSLMVDKRLMFRDGDLFLSLALPVTSCGKEQACP